MDSSLGVLMPGLRYLRGTEAPTSGPWVPGEEVDGFPQLFPKSQSCNHHGRDGFKVNLEIGNYQEVVMYCLRLRGSRTQGMVLVNTWIWHIKARLLRISVFVGCAGLRATVRMTCGHQDPSAEINAYSLCTKS